MQNQGITTKLHQGINKRKTQRDRRTIVNVTRFRINQEIKFMYQNKENLNRQLYRAHLEGAHYHNGMWQHVKKLNR